MNRAAIACLFTLATAGASELLDPPSLVGWRYEHRAEHAIAGAAIDVLAIEAVRHVAPAWAQRHPIGAQVIGALAAGTAAVGKERFDRAHGGESLHHSATDVAVTVGGGVAVGFAWSLRW